jgi:glycosyltransferase involved in cell wall biosynthesis
LDALKSRVKEMRLDNIQFGGERSVTEVPQIVARADVCLSSLLPEPYLEKIVSVKVFEYFACAKPVVVAQAGETAEIVRESKGGIVVPTGDSPAMAQAILALYRDPSLRQEMGKRGRQFVECNYSRALTAARLENTLCTLQNVPSTA